MQFDKIIYLILSLSIISIPCYAYKQNPTDSKDNNSTVKSATDSINTAKPRPYKEIIISSAITKKGLFTVHKIKERYFFELPDSLLDQDILLVSRIAMGAADYRPRDGSFGFAGDKIGEKVIRFCRGPNNKVFIKTISYWERSLDSSDNGMYRTVHNSNMSPIIWSFDIKAYSPDSSSSVIDATDFINSDNSILYFDPLYKKNVFELGAQQMDKSYVIDINSFPTNVELKKVNTYLRGDHSLTYELNSSFVLLPKIPMKPRYSDERVGYWSQSYTDYDLPQGVQYTNMIIRWRLEPKGEDKEKYSKGELVEPKKPIVYYIDPATPKKWVPYLIQGVNDWQKAFEKAGFKNAIYALEAPENDPNFSLFDARHNAIIYKASVVTNASGPQIHDPRTGEILETHVNWYSNVIQILHDWYMIQAGPNDPKARSMVFDDSLMGKLIRYVACHEVGHTLGLLHNFGASSTFPVDSLRSKQFVQKNGFCPSIMDYARFNYVAQPGDSMSEKELLPKIGVYDEWAIEWGYKWLPQLKTREEEEEYMNKWIISSLEKNKHLWYGPQDFTITDPRAQQEDLGDDAIKASYYGIQNLKNVMQHLKDWAKEPNKDYSSLSRMWNQVILQYQRYLAHVLNNIKRNTWTAKTSEQGGPLLGFVSKEKQKRAVAFFDEQLFKTPLWLNDKDISLLIGGPGPLVPTILQSDIINSLVNYLTYLKMYFSEAESSNTYTYNELLNDLEKCIWSELETGKSIDTYRRNLQKIYIERLIECSISKEDEFGKLRLELDFIPICKEHLKKLQYSIDKVLKKHWDSESLNHLMAIENRIKQSKDANPFLINDGSQGNHLIFGFKDFSDIELLSNQKSLNYQCWPSDEVQKWKLIPGF